MQRVAQDGRAAVRRRTQPNDLRTQLHGAIVVVTGLVIQRDVQTHAGGKINASGGKTSISTRPTA